MKAFPDIESLLMELLTPIGYCCTSAPPDLNSRIEDGPVIRINRTGGGDNRITDTARVSIDIFASSWEEAQEAGEGVRQALLVYPIQTSLGIIDDVVTEKSHIDIPWGDPDVFRRNASYTISTRR